MHLIIFQNQDDKALFITYKILKNQSSDIIPGSGVDTEHFYFNQKQTPDNVTKFLFIGR